MFASSWAIAGGVAALAGVIARRRRRPALTPDGRSSSPSLAFPAIILGGLDSPGGAVVGGIIIGITQTLTAGYQDELRRRSSATNFQRVMPYVVMMLILLIRPYGLFGTQGGASGV